MSGISTRYYQRIFAASSTMPLLLFPTAITTAKEHQHSASCPRRHQAPLPLAMHGQQQFMALFITAWTISHSCDRTKFCIVPVFIAECYQPGEAPWRRRSVARQRQTRGHADGDPGENRCTRRGHAWGHRYDMFSLLKWSGICGEAYFVFFFLFLLSTHSLCLRIIAGVDKYTYTHRRVN